MTTNGTTWWHRVGVLTNVLTFIFLVAISWSALQAAVGNFGTWLVGIVDTPEVQSFLRATLNTIVAITATAVSYWAANLYSKLLDSMRRRREHNERIMDTIAHLKMEGTVHGVLLRQIAKGADATAMADALAKLRQMVIQSNFKPNIRDSFLELVSQYADVVSTDEKTRDSAS